MAVTGGSGSGKSWLADRLARALGNLATRLSLDDFYRDRSHLAAARRAQLNYDHPRAIDWPALELVLRRARSGDSVSLPHYDFATHCRSPETRRLKLGPVLILDGLWLLRRRSIRKLFGLGIYIDCPADVRLERRIHRDLAERGRDALSIRRQFRQTVAPMHARFVAPQERFAEIVVEKGFGAEKVAELAELVRARIGEPWTRGKAASFPRKAAALKRPFAQNRKLSAARRKAGSQSA